MIMLIQYIYVPRNTNDINQKLILQKQCSFVTLCTQDLFNCCTKVMKKLLITTNTNYYKHTFKLYNHI